MKRVIVPALGLLLIASLTAATADHFLLAENFFLKKGDKLSARLFNGLQAEETETGEQPAAEEGKFTLYEGSKKVDIATKATDSVTAIQDYTVQNQGVTLLQFTQEPEFNEVDKDEYEQHFTDEGKTELAKKAAKVRKVMIKEKSTRFLKTLVKVDKASGNVYEKLLGDEFEIILKNNPYKLNYGDDIVAILYLKGKPLVDENLMLYVKTPSGNVHPQKLTTDTEGKAYFKLSREGIYLLRSSRTVASDTKDADFETLWTSFTFAFSSANELPNTYKEFGFGDKH